MAASRQEIQGELCRFMGESILASGAPPGPDDSLAGLGVDSFSLMEIVLFIERRFGLVLPVGELTPENIASASALAACVERALANPPAQAP